MPEFPRYGVHRVDVATPETPSPSGRNPQAELLMYGGQTLMGVAQNLQQVVNKRKDLASDTQANERFRLLQEQTYAWEAEKEKTADPDAHAAQQNQFIQESVNKLISDTKDPMVVQKFLTKASGFRVERLHHAYGIQNRAFVDREKADVIAETQNLGKHEYLYTNDKFDAEWAKLQERFAKAESVGAMTREERQVAEQKAVDTIWGTRAYRQAVQKQPKNDDPFGVATMWDATKAMEMGVDKRYDNLSPERRIAITGQMREEYTRRLTQVNTLEAEKRRVFNEDRDAMVGVFYANIEKASRNEEFELDGKPGRHSIEDVVQAANKYSGVLGSRLNGIHDNARAYQAIRDRGDKARPATQEEHLDKVKWMNKVYQGEVNDRDIINSPLRAEFKDEVLRIFYQEKHKPKTPEERARQDHVKDLGRYIKKELNVQTSAFVRDPRIAGIAERASLEFTTLARRDPEADLAELASSILKRNSEHLKGSLDPGLLHSQLPDRYKTEDEEVVMADLRSRSITREAADFYLVQMRWIKGMRKSAPATQGPAAPVVEDEGIVSKIRKLVAPGPAKAKVRQGTGE